MSARFMASKMRTLRSKTTLDAVSLAVAVVVSCCAISAAVKAYNQLPGSASVADDASAMPPARHTSETSPRLTNFTFRDQLGQTVTRRDLQGHVWIADFVYTACQSACPLLTSRLVTLQHRLLDPTLRFVSFSVDPETDTPEILNQYATRWNHGDRRWRLLSTDASGLADLTSSMRLELQREQGELVHTNRFFLIDAEGSVTAEYDSADDAAIERLLADTARLLGTAPANAVTGAGRELFSSLGCAGCHNDAQLAPPLAGLLGTRVMFERGGAVLVDDAYIRESIATPEARVVAGYPSSMPAYGTLLSGAQLSSLVSYVHSLRGEHRASAETARPEVDAVCGMPTRVTKRTPSVVYRGHSYHFCSRSCAKLFQSNPAKYVADPNAHPRQ